MGIADATFYNREKKYGGLGPSEVRRLKQLEEENAKLKKLVADLSLIYHAAGCAVKKALKPSRKRSLIDELRDRYRASLRQTRALFRMSRSLYAYKSKARDATPLIMCIEVIAATRDGAVGSKGTRQSAFVSLVWNGAAGQIEFAATMDRNISVPRY